MKIKAFSIAFLSLLSFCTYAQDSTLAATKTHTWFTGKHAKPFKKLNYLGFYVNPEIGYGGFAGGYTPVGGMSASLVFNKKWAIGLAGYSTNYDYTPTKLSSSKALNFNAQYGGLTFEYTPKPDAVVHVSFPLLIGGAMATIDSVSSLESNKKDWFGRGDFGQKGEGGRGGRGGDFGGRNGEFQNESMFFVIQPGIKLETNVLRIAKLYIGANYRIAAGKSNLETSVPAFIPKSGQLSGLSVNFGAKVGIFDFDVQKKRHLPSLKMGRRSHRGHKSE
jgi:hypothetical protein